MVNLENKGINPITLPLKGVAYHYFKSVNYTAHLSFSFLDKMLLSGLDCSQRCVAINCKLMFGHN